MRCVGHVYFRQKDAAEELERSYQAASGAGARAILHEQLAQRAQAEQEEREKARAEEAAKKEKRPAAWREREAVRRALLDEAHEVFDVSADWLVCDRFPARCDPLCSFARREDDHRGRPSSGDDGEQPLSRTPLSATRGRTPSQSAGRWSLCFELL